MTTDAKHETTFSTPSDTEIRIERTFDAAPGAIWEAYTDPELFAQWIGPRRLQTRVERMDVRPGGTYRYVAADPDGQEFAFNGEYLKVEAPRLLVATFSYEGFEAPPSTDRLELEATAGGGTSLVATSTFESKELRDGMLESGMKGGVTEGYEKLDELLARRS